MRIFLDGVKKSLESYLSGPRGSVVAKDFRRRQRLWRDKTLIPDEIKTLSIAPIECRLLQRDIYTYRIFRTSLMAEPNMVIINAIKKQLLRSH